MLIVEADEKSAFFILIKIQYLVGTNDRGIWMAIIKNEYPTIADKSRIIS